MKDPLTVSIKKEEVTLNTIKQHVVETTDRRKQDALCTVLDQDNPFMAIIFCRTKRRVDELEMALYRRGYNCQKLHSDILQSKRERIMKAFRNGDFQYLIATDVASRGLDISGVSHIYNYDIPESVEGYIHRIGRTGRAGEEGYSCLFIDPKNKVMLEEIEKNIKFKIPRRELDGGKNG
jgi:superfamily II DNA/RNA helicase